MTIQRIIELLEIEHECILRNSHDDCDRNCADCDLVQDDEELHEMYTDAIALLKEQEAVKPILIREGRNKHYNDYVCPRCDNEVVYEQNYCSECGVEFMWEGR
jgi:hypothetical protein